MLPFFFYSLRDGKKNSRIMIRARKMFLKKLYTVVSSCESFIWFGFVGEREGLLTIKVNQLLSRLDSTVLMLCECGIFQLSNPQISLSLRPLNSPVLLLFYCTPHSTKKLHHQTKPNQTNWCKVQPFPLRSVSRTLDPILERLVGSKF
jgi:hypothetical protein